MLSKAFLISCFVCYVKSDSVLIIGGEVDSLLNPSIAQIEAYGSCGLFNPGVPDLPHTDREFGATRVNNLIVSCGGYGIFGAVKKCYSLDLDVQPLAWTEFPELQVGRHNFGMITLGEDIFAIGGSTIVGSVRAIEKYNWSEGLWEQFSEIQGFREDFCALPWGNDAIALIGGYDSAGSQRRCEVFNTTDLSWKVLTPLNLGRGQHACTWFKGSIVAAGGWAVNEDNPDDIGQLPVRSVEVYNVETDSWEDMEPMKHRRTMFGFAEINGDLTAIAGWEGLYLDSVEKYEPHLNVWEYDQEFLAVKKSAFATVHMGDYFQDIECPNNSTLYINYDV